MSAHICPSLASVARRSLLLALLPLGALAASPGRTTTFVVPAAGTTTTTPDKGALPIQLSSDGRYVMFGSTASNLIANFVDHQSDPTSLDVYQRDLQTGTTTLVSHKAGLPSEGGEGRNFIYRMSDDGSIVAFLSESKTIAGGSSANAEMVFYWERDTNTVSLLYDVNAISSSLLALSGDGKWIAFCSDRQMPKNTKNTALGFHNNPGVGVYNIYLVNRVTGEVVLVTHLAGAPSSPSPTVNAQFNAFLSTDGRYCSFKASTVVAGWDSYTGTFPSNCQAYYLYDRQADTMTLLSKRNDGAGRQHDFL
jgi:Tol biopolymer transport system component